MAITVVSSNKVFASIEDLPENMGVMDGDRFIVQSEGGTVLVDFENIKIDLDHTTFGDTITNLLTFSSSATDFIDNITEQFNDVATSVAVMNDGLTTVQEQLEGLKLLCLLMMGYKDNESEESVELLLNDVPEGGKGFVYETYYTMRDERDRTFTLTANNLLRVNTKVEDFTAEVEDLKKTIENQNEVIANFQTSMENLPYYKVGDIKWTFDSVQPKGFLKLNGQWVAKDEFLDLYEHLSKVLGSSFKSNDYSFQLPDMRGAFPRVVNEDKTDGYNVGRQSGTTQSPALPNIKGTIRQDNDILIEGVLTGAFKWVQQDKVIVGCKNDGYGAIVNFDASYSSSVYKNGVNEVIPYNMSMYAYIKY